MSKFSKLFFLTSYLSLSVALADPVLEQEIEILNGNNTPAYILKQLTSISLEAGEQSIAISSKGRTVKKQVEVMLDYYIRCTKGRFANKKEICGIKLAKQVYHTDCHGGFSDYEVEQSKEKNIEVMSEALTESLKALGESRTCMNHVIMPGIKTQYIAVDIKPSSISNLKKFYLAVKANTQVKRFYYPNIRGVEPSAVKESAFHIEFERQAVEPEIEEAEPSDPTDA
jgi:hypothetical protein